MAFLTQQVTCVLPRCCVVQNHAYVMVTGAYKYLPCHVLLLLVGTDHLLGVPLSSNPVLVFGSIVFSVMLVPAKEAPLQKS